MQLTNISSLCRAFMYSLFISFNFLFDLHVRGQKCASIIPCSECVQRIF